MCALYELMGGKEQSKNASIQLSWGIKNTTLGTHVLGFLVLVLTMLYHLSRLYKYNHTLHNYIEHLILLTRISTACLNFKVTTPFSIAEINK